MTFTQSGSNATVNIYGTFNDVHGNQTFNPKQAHQRQIAENTLEDTIQIIRNIATSVSINTANIVLTDIATMLSLLQKHARSNGNLCTFTRNCKAICETVALAAKGASMGRMSGPYGNAFSVLQSSIDGLRSRTEKTLKHGVIQRLFHLGLDVKIRSWTDELDNIFVLFSARLNIVPIIPLEQMYELLQQSDVPNLIPDPPPLPPAIFFGREELLSGVKAALLRDEGVALIGPGGIGKSTLVMAVMNEEDIMKHYRRRFFVTYADMSPKSITFDSFVDRIASIVGLPMSGAKGERHIKTNFSLSSVLLVLDNAETFEDAVDRIAATRISEFIAHIANSCQVNVILTTRTNSNARRVNWTRFDVPTLMREPARHSFRKIYNGEISDDEVDKLLAAVDFHPLSISILAYAATENRWSGKVLQERWESQHSKIFETGDGKDNLGFTIRLSLESPSITALGNDALHVLWVIAFFPQGIQANQDYLMRLFPSVLHISFVMDTFCRVSLIHPCGPFLTMLAPIRLFVLDTLETGGHELLGEARRVYYGFLSALSRDKSSRADLLVSDHLNIESLIMFDLAHSQPGSKIQDVLFSCFQFLRGLRFHKPRPTLLAHTITSLPEETDAQRQSKAWCLDALGELYFELSNYSFSSTASSAAQKLFVAVGNYTKAARCASTTALSYIRRGHFLRAQQLLDDFIHSTFWQHVDEERKAKAYYTLDVSRMHLSSENVNEFFLRSMKDRSRGLQSHLRHWQARMHHGYTTPEEVHKHIEPLRFPCMSSPDSDAWKRWRFLETAAEAAFLQRKFDVATDLLDQGHKSVNGSFQLSVKVLICKAAIASEQGRHDLSRALSQRCIDTLGVVATTSSTEFLQVCYVQGRNELYAGEYQVACQFLADVIAQCDVCDEIRTKAFCMRALGEAEILLDRKTDPNQYFVQTIAICKESGTPPELLGVCDPLLKLDDSKFPEWRRFLAAHTGCPNDLHSSHSVGTTSLTQ